MSLQIISLIVMAAVAVAIMALAGVFALAVYLGWFKLRPDSAAMINDFKFTKEQNRAEEVEHKAQSAKLNLERPSEDKPELAVEKAEVPYVSSEQPLEKRE